MKGGRRGLVSLAAVAAIFGAALPTPRPVHAADPTAVARQELSRQHGGSPNDYQLVAERVMSADVAGAPMWAGKFLDARTGEIHSAYRTEDGRIGSVAVLDESVALSIKELPALDRKADRPLVAAVAGSAAAEKLPVAIWLNVDVAPAEQAVRSAHPEVEWIAGRPVAHTLEEARALRGELWEARRDAYAQAAASIEAELAALGAKVAYVSTSAPLVFVDMPAGRVAALARRGDVMSIGLENKWRRLMSSAGPTVSANWHSGSADRGSGVRVAVVEYHNVSNSGDLAGKVVARYSTTGRYPTHIHPTWVAGAIASRSSTWTGVAPGSYIVSASTGGYRPGLTTDRAIIRAADWAVARSGGDADVVNVSLGQDTATGAEEARRYFDSIGWEDGRLVVAAAGNFGTFGHWNVVSPGTGYNVLTVGGLNDRGTGGTGDDVLWYVPGSNGASYRDPSGTSWNRHGDFNKPNLSAPAVSVRTANGAFGDGTSVASPIVAGIAAQLIARSPSLATFPEATRAILMAGALRRTPMPGGGFSRDHEGVGSASALWSNRVLSQGAYGGWTMGAILENQPVTRNIPVVRGQKVRVALAWSSHTAGTSNTGKADSLRADLDLVVRQPNGTVIGSYSWDNSYEVIDFTATSTGTVRITVNHDRFDTTQEPFGLAWALTSPYTDVTGSKYYAHILWVAQQRIMGGCQAAKFCPHATITRGALAQALSDGLNLPRTSTDFYSDDEGSRFESGINRLRAAGLTTGCGGDRYCPGALVTRGALATALATALRLPAADRDYFTDDNRSRHEANINRIARAGITTGCSGSRYCPGGLVPRDQAAVFLRRAFD
jgi:Subtilase family